MKSAVTPAEQRVVLDNVSWSTYVSLVADVEGRGGRITFDQGVLEIMSPSIRHENAKGLLRRLLEAASEELGVEILSAGSLTLKREDLQRGIEPDECYYIEHAAAVRGKEEIDLTVDPPPDLAIEIDITRSSLDKLAIYLALGVPECWRYDGERLTIRARGADGQYRVVERSAVLTGLAVDDLVRFLNRRHAEGETQLVREFRRLLRDRLAEAGGDAG